MSTLSALREQIMANAIFLHPSTPNLQIIISLATDDDHHSRHHNSPPTTILPQQNFRYEPKIPGYYADVISGPTIRSFDGAADDNGNGGAAIVMARGGAGGDLEKAYMSLLDVLALKVMGRKEAGLTKDVE